MKQEEDSKYIPHKCVILGKYLEIVLKWTDGNTEERKQLGPSCEIVDFRAPGHPEVTWKWIDAHQREIFNSLPLFDS